MLYITGNSVEVQASRSQDLQNYRNNRLSDYEKLAKQEEV